MVLLAVIYCCFIGLGLHNPLLGAAWPLMSADFAASLSSAGTLSMLASCTTIASSLFAHLLVQRIGTGKVVLSGISLIALSMLLFGISQSYPFLFLCTIPMGLGAGCIDSSLNSFMAAHYKARYLSWMHCFWGLGAMLAPLFIAFAFGLGYSWRGGYILIFIILATMVVMLLLTQRLWRHIEKAPGAQSAAPSGVGMKGMLEALRIKGAPLAFATFFLYASVEKSMMLWGASYLVQVRGLSADGAAFWVSAFFLGVTLGRLLGGFVSFKLSDAALIRTGLMLACVGLITMLLPLPNAAVYASFLLVGLGLAPLFPSMMHQTPLIFGVQHAPALTSMQIAFLYLSSTFVPTLLGVLFSHTSFALMPYLLLGCVLLCIITSSRLAAQRTPHA